MSWEFSLDADSLVTRIKFRFLEYQFGFGDFPKKNQINIIDVKYAFYGPCMPQKATKNGYCSEE